MVSQQLLPPAALLMPRSLLPASSLEPLEADERVLRSFESVGVAAAGGENENEAGAAAEANAAGTLHVTSRYRRESFVLILSFFREQRHWCR